MINRKFFFDHIKVTLFQGRLTQSQVDGLTFIVDSWEKNHAVWDDRWLAYALGTTHLETGAKMTPVHEIGGTAYFEAMYGPTGHNPARAKRMGNTAPGDGARYCGRGYVQLTWEVNYKAMSDHLTAATGAPVDLVANPDLAMQPDFAAEIMFYGMDVGTFSGRKFSDYFTKDASGNPAKDNWVGARAIINGTDKAQVIADFSQKYYAAISYL